MCVYAAYIIQHICTCYNNNIIPTVHITEQTLLIGGSLLTKIPQNKVQSHRQNYWNMDGETERNRGGI